MPPRKKKRKKKFIQQAIKREGRLQRLAAREGGLNPDGTIKMSWLLKKKKQAMQRGDRSLLGAVNLAIRFKKGDLARKRKRKKRKGR